MQERFDNFNGCYRLIIITNKSKLLLGSEANVNKFIDSRHYFEKWCIENTGTLFNKIIEKRGLDNYNTKELWNTYNRLRSDYQKCLKKLYELGDKKHFKDLISSLEDYSKNDYEKTHNNGEYEVVI